MVSRQTASTANPQNPNQNRQTGPPAPKETHQVALQNYRNSTLGISLQQVLKDFQQQQQLDVNMSEMILQYFDQAIAENFRDLPSFNATLNNNNSNNQNQNNMGNSQMQQPMNNQSSRPAKLTAKCYSYRNVDEVWIYDLEEMELRDEAITLRLQSTEPCRIVSIDAANNKIEDTAREAEHGNTSKKTKTSKRANGKGK